MKKALFTAAFAALALGSAQALVQTWTSFGNTGKTGNTCDITTANGCGTVVALISYTGQNLANILQVDNVGDVAAGIRLEDGQIGIRKDSGFYDSTKKVSVTAGNQYVVAITYAYDADADTLTATFYADGKSLGTIVGSNVATAPATIGVDAFDWSNDGSFYDLESVSVYDSTLSMDQVTWLSDKKATVLPEPTALALLALGVAGVALRRRVA